MLKVRFVSTAVGTLWSVVVPSPSCPAVPLPQQYAMPVLVNPHVCAVPADIVLKVRLPETATGTGWLVVVPSPSCPLALYPQQ